MAGLYRVFQRSLRAGSRAEPHASHPGFIRLDSAMPLDHDASGFVSTLNLKTL